MKKGINAKVYLYDNGKYIEIGQCDMLLTNESGNFDKLLSKSNTVSINWLCTYRKAAKPKRGFFIFASYAVALHNQSQL